MVPAALTLTVIWTVTVIEVAVSPIDRNNQPTVEIKPIISLMYSSVYAGTTLVERDSRP